MMTEQPQVRVGVTALLVHPETGKVLLIHRINKLGYDSWAPAGGHQEFGETPQQTAVREYNEELGLVLSPESLTPIGYTNDYMPDTNKHYITLYFGGIYPLEQQPQIKEPQIIDQWDWFALDEFPENLFVPMANYMAVHRAVLQKYMDDVMAWAA